MSDVVNKFNAYRSKMNEATKELRLYYEDFEEDFTLFFKDLITESLNKKKELEKEYNL